MAGSLAMNFELVTFKDVLKLLFKLQVSAKYYE